LLASNNGCSIVPQWAKTAWQSSLIAFACGVDFATNFATDSVKACGCEMGWDEMGWDEMG
jgi:hypothetical protein